MKLITTKQQKRLIQLLVDHGSSAVCVGAANEMGREGAEACLRFKVRFADTLQEICQILGIDSLLVTAKGVDLEEASHFVSSTLNPDMERPSD